MEALNFRRPDVLPLFENYWSEFVEEWRIAKGLREADGHTVGDYYGNDILTAGADESPWPGQKAALEGSACSIFRSGWGGYPGRSKAVTSPRS